MNNSQPLWLQKRSEFLAANENMEWRDGQPPDYSTTESNFQKEKSCQHASDSLAHLVENLVKCFEVEASFKTNPQQWLSVATERFRISTNGAHQYTASDIIENGTYNLFLAEHKEYTALEENLESSNQLFSSTFPEGFLWEVLDVYSLPPKIVFKWRHWGKFKGNFKNFQPTGETIEIIGMSYAEITEDFKIITLEHFFDSQQFWQSLTSLPCHK
ncbi:MAG: SnoaL-like polyketide cyclase [Nostochopsis sp.]